MFFLSISPSIVNLGQYQFRKVSSLTLSSDWFSSLRSIILFESSTLDRNKTSFYNSCIGYLKWTFRVMSSGKTVCCNVSMLIVGHLGRIWSELWRTSLIKLLTKEHDSSLWPAIERWCISLELSGNFHQYLEKKLTCYPLSANTRTMGAAQCPCLVVHLSVHWAREGTIF
jgi:hypothetical protein